MKSKYETFDRSRLLVKPLAEIATAEGSSTPDRSPCFGLVWTR
jgi:hypothetical protein